MKTCDASTNTFTSTTYSLSDCTGDIVSSTTAIDGCNQGITLGIDCTPDGGDTNGNETPEPTTPEPTLPPGVTADPTSMPTEYPVETGTDNSGIDGYTLIYAVMVLFSVMVI